MRTQSTHRSHTVPGQRAVMTWLRLGLLFVGISTSATATEELGMYAIKLSGVVQEPPLALALDWETQANGVSVELYRRRLTTDNRYNWSSLGTFAANTTSYLDNDLSAGVAYEYKIHRPSQKDASDTWVDPAGGYWAAGSAVSLRDQRGTILLAVAPEPAATLDAELARLEMDLVGDGWIVERHDHAETDSAADLRQTVTKFYASATGPTRMLFLFGRLPVVKSGWDGPDGHGSVAHATDTYYADVDGTWTDTTNYGNGNTDGDGIFDQKRVPDNGTELPVGRVDLAGMSAWPDDEVALLRAYLDKNHHYRHAITPVPRRTLWDKLAYDDTAFESHAARAFVGEANAVKGDFTIEGQRDTYLWGVDFSDWNGSNYPDYRFRIAFALNFGSHKQKWDNGNNPMRAILCMPWHGLTCIWGVRPNWILYGMGLGEPIGLSQWRSVNNASGEYYPVDDYGGYMAGGVWINLMGDPSLRLFPLRPPSAVQAQTSGDDVSLTWQASDQDTLLGYHVYRASDRLGPYTRLTDTPNDGTTYTDTGAAGSDAWYQVRAVAHQYSGMGTWIDASQGAFTAYLNGTGNQAPRAPDQDLATDEDTALAITLAGTDDDGDALAYGIAGPPQHGELAGMPPALTYTPTADYVGQDSFQYTVHDGCASTIGTITITMRPVDDPVTGIALHRAAITGRAVACVLEADDVDDDPLSYQVASAPSSGTLADNPPYLRYRADVSAEGIDTFTYTVDDGITTAPTSTVTLHVAPFGTGTHNASFTSALSDDWVSDAGVWEVRDGALHHLDGKSNGSLRLHAATAGDWGDCEIFVRVKTVNGSKPLGIRFHQQDNSQQMHYRFVVSDAAMKIVKRTWSDSTVAEVTTGISVDTWHEIRLRVQGTTAQAWVDDTQVFAEAVVVDDDRIQTGPPALYAEKDKTAVFDDFCIAYAGPPRRSIRCHVDGAAETWGLLDGAATARPLMGDGTTWFDLPPSANHVLDLIRFLGANG